MERVKTICMHQPYNSSRIRQRFSDYGRNIGVCIYAATLVFGAIGCRKASSEAVPTPPAPPAAADPKAQADEFYSQRADLMKVRQALIVLRQADTANPSDYEIAWRLARANYYLAHTAQTIPKLRGLFAMAPRRES